MTQKTAIKQDIQFPVTCRKNIQKQANLAIYVWNYFIDVQVKSHKYKSEYKSLKQMIAMFFAIKNSQKNTQFNAIHNSIAINRLVDLNKAINLHKNHSYGFPKKKGNNDSQVSIRFSDGFIAKKKAITVDHIGKIKLQSELHESPSTISITLNSKKKDSISFTVNKL